MISTIPKTHFFLPEDLHTYELPQIFSVSTAWIEFGMDKRIATFDLIIRDMPPHRNFLLSCGIEEIILGILKWKYTSKEIKSLLRNETITPKFAEYLKKFRFTGDVSAIPEGTIFFPGEPIVRITAPIIEANILSMFLLNTICGNVKYLSKIVRCVHAANPKPCYGVAGLRADSFESAMKCARASYIAGSIGANLVHSFANKFNLPLSNVMVIAYHAYIKSFPSELEAMRKISILYKGKINLMVDTYEFEQGMRNAIKVAKELEEKGWQLAGITIDSGNLFERAVRAKARLISANLHYIKITITGNLDEYKIKEYMDKKIPADSFIIATEAITVPDSPKIESVYKLAELRDNGNIRYCAKFSPGKESYPGRKQVFRTCKNKIMAKDIIGLEDEQLGEPLLIEVIKNGKLGYKLPNLNQIKEHIQSQIRILPKELLDINKQHKYKVETSRKLQNLFHQVKKDHCNNEV